VVSGVASVAGGGSFANGAITGAFGYLFNQAAQNRDQHAQGVQMVQNYLTLTGNEIVEPDAVGVAVPGFATYRYYDFIFRSPDSDALIGAEVKTGMYETARLNSAQIAKDAAVVAQGGTVVLSGLPVSQVEYFTYCNDGCSVGDLRPFDLKTMLEVARIPVKQVLRPIPGPP
jgi:hypothetical protein